MLHILLYLQNKSMEYSDFWNTYKSINSLLYGALLTHILDKYYISSRVVCMISLFKTMKKPICIEFGRIRKM